MDVRDLLKLLLVLVIVWIVLELLGEVLDMVFVGPLALLRPFIGLIIIVLIVLWFLDYI